MSSPLITVDIKALSHDAVKLMVEKNISALVVKEKDAPMKKSGQNAQYSLKIRGSGGF